MTPTKLRAAKAKDPGCFASCDYIIIYNIYNMIVKIHGLESENKTFSIGGHYKSLEDEQLSFLRSLREIVGGGTEAMLKGFVEV